MLTISVWPRRLKEFLLTHPLYKSPASSANGEAASSPLVQKSPIPLFTFTNS